MTTKQRFTITGRLDQIERVGASVRKAALAAGFDERTAGRCELAVCEACENIIVHGYGEEEAGPIGVVIRSSLGELTVELDDTAPPFDPSAAPSMPAWTQDEPPVGGLGLTIIHRAMDEVAYRRRGNRNLLRLSKRSRPTGT